MSSLMHCFSAISGSIREKTKMDINGYHSDVKYVFELRRTYPNYWHGGESFTSILSLKEKGIVKRSN